MKEPLIFSQTQTMYRQNNLRSNPLEQAMAGASEDDIEMVNLSCICSSSCFQGNFVLEVHPAAAVVTRGFTEERRRLDQEDMLDRRRVGLLSRLLHHLGPVSACIDIVGVSGPDILGHDEGCGGSWRGVVSPP